MGINLSDYIEDANELFTFEEAEKLFIAAGYTKKSRLIDGFEQVNISYDTLMKNHPEEYPERVEKNSDFEISVKSTHMKFTTSIKSFVYDVNEVNVKKSISSDLGGAA